jgi:hypothetical protein
MGVARVFGDKFAIVANLPFTVTALYEFVRFGVPEEAIAKAIEQAIRIAQSGQEIDRDIAADLVARQKTRRSLCRGKGRHSCDRAPLSCRLSGTLGFFRSEDYLRRPKGDYPPEDVIARIRLLNRRLGELLTREAARRKNLLVYVGQEARDRWHRGVVMSKVADLAVAEFYDDDDNWDLLLKRIASASEKREREGVPDATQAKNQRMDWKYSHRPRKSRASRKKNAPIPDVNGGRF